jgi:hypothetical protein
MVTRIRLQGDGVADYPDSVQADCLTEIQTSREECADKLALETSTLPGKEREDSNSQRQHTCFRMVRYVCAIILRMTTRY